MAFRIGNRVISAIGLLLFLFFVTSSVAHLLTQRVKDDVFRLVGVDDRKRSAAVDLRAQLDAFARTAVAYAYGRDATGKEQAGQSKDRLGRSASRLSKLATTGEERELVREFNALFEDFVSQGDQVIAVVDRERAEIVALPHHKEIAIWAGTTPESVARAMGRLIEANVVKRRFKPLHILDPERLKALVDAT
ncbi:MAG: helix-turn-helix domain-containing protein [Alphaproteobacteria bacterium]